MGFVYRKYAVTGSKDSAGRRFAPMAPGATRSPQIPGMVPDISTIPEHGTLPIPLPVDGSRRPLTEYMTSQRVMGVYTNSGKDELDPERFNTMRLPSYEEVRKAVPAAIKPVRPIAGFALSGSGSRLSEQMAALEAAAHAETDVEAAGASVEAPKPAGA